MCRFVTFHSFHRGTGKSTLTANLAVLLAQSGLRIGVADADLSAPGQHILLGLNEVDVHHTLNDYLWGQCGIEAAIHNQTPQFAQRASLSGKLYLVPANTSPIAIARGLREGYTMERLHMGLTAMSQQLQLDLLLIDTPSGLTEDSLKPFALADKLVLLLRHDQRDYQGTAVTVDVARRLGLPHLMLIVNQSPSIFALDEIKTRVEQTYNCPVLGIIPFSDDMVGLAGADLFVLHHPLHPITQLLRRMAAQLTG